MNKPAPEMIRACATQEDLPEPPLPKPYAAEAECYYCDCKLWVNTTAVGIPKEAVPVCLSCAMEADPDGSMPWVMPMGNQA
jgi:hypothetical protein